MNYGQAHGPKLTVCTCGCELHFINSLKFKAHTHTTHICIMETNNNLSYIIRWQSLDRKGDPSSCQCARVCGSFAIYI